MGENMLTSFKAIAEEAKKRGGKKIAVAGADGKAVLEAVKIARDSGIMEPILVGDCTKIEVLAKGVGLTLEGITFYDKTRDIYVAEKAVELVHTDCADGLMKEK